MPPNAKLQVKALKETMKCPSCTRGPTNDKFKHFDALVSHLLAKGGASHVTWRAQNAELVVQLRGKKVGKNEMTPVERQLQVAAKEGSKRLKEQRCAR